jgi:acetyl-CoA carboxylase carboxyltransferase component
MNSKSIGADIEYAWSTARIGTMDPEAAVKIMYADEISGDKFDNSKVSELTKEYTEKMSSAMAAARRGYVDNIITADSARKNLVYAFEMLYLKEEGRPDKKHGTI